MRLFIIATLFLFGTIGVLGWLKKNQSKKGAEEIVVQEIDLGTSSEPISIQTELSREKEVLEVDRIQQLFALDSSKLPIVETVSFTSRVPWLKGRPAWLADYASHFETSRHFIARSLNRKVDYLTQKVHPGDRFNVFKEGKDLKFHLLVDLSKCKMWFYYFDGEEKVLLKTYRVGVGKKELLSVSGYLTPIGTYRLGEKVAIYKPGITGYFQDQKIEMIQVFGTRWLPFGEELEGCSEPSKGFGIHGAPWKESEEGQLVEDLNPIGKSDSDGCIRMTAEDIEEIFAIVITKPTTVQIVKEVER